MYFKAAIVSTLAAYATAASISAQETVNNINGITALSKDLNTKAKAVNLLNVFETGPQVINGFKNIVTQATKDLEAMVGESSKRDVDVGVAGRVIMSRAPPITYTTAEQHAVCEAFIDFVKVHQALLATVIGKHGLLELTLIAYPAAAVLRSVEGVVDNIAFTLIAEVPTCAAEANKQKEKLDDTLTKSINTYAQGLP